MPLRDRFRHAAHGAASWEGFHGGWPMVIVQHLGRLLPPHYMAEPRVHLGSQVEVDVATYDRQGISLAPQTLANEPSAAATDWTPEAPTLMVETELADFDEYEVRVHDVSSGRRLVAAIELISPGNKDRPESRSQFVAKCAALLRNSVSVVLVDPVTTRDFNLYAELLELIGEQDEALTDHPPSTYAVSCRWLAAVNHRLETWSHRLEVGKPLPCLPLWLADDFAIPLDLEASYEQTCRDLRIA